MPDISLPTNGGWLPDLRSADAAAAVLSAAVLQPSTNAGLSSARMHLSSDIGKDLRESNVPAEGHQDQRGWLAIEW